MSAELIQYLPELLSISVIAVFMAITPGTDFVMVTRNSILYGRSAGLYSSLGICLAVWIHVAYSIAGLAVIISQSIVLFSIVKYLGAIYLIYVGWKTFRSKSQLNLEEKTGNTENEQLPQWSAFRMGFMSNALNPKTTMFFIGVFTQVVNPETPLWLQIIYGAIISLAHLLWFAAVSIFLSQPALLRKFQQWKTTIEKVIGGLLIGFGLKVATAEAA